MNSPTGNGKMADIFAGFSLAFGMLTILPFFNVHRFSKAATGYAVMFYPLVGALLGGILWLVYTLLLPYFPEPHLKIFLLVLWTLLTGALHLDGFSDTVDGLYVPKERAKEVMKDPHVGGMGMVFTVLLLFFKGSALWYFDAIWLLPLLLMLSRYNAALAIYLFPYITEAGMGTPAKAAFTKRQLAVSTLLLLPLLLFTPKGWLLLAVSLPTLWLVARFFNRRLGGFSGDVYGFLIEVTELVLLNAALFEAAA
jgi:adenosylcobinamide-GDP ribazoletransferase